MKVLKNWRYYVLLLLGTIAVFGIFGVPDDDSKTFLADMIISKIIGFGAGYIIFRLYLHWSKEDYTPEIDKLINEED